MEIYNTLTRKKEAFEPRKDKKVQMFVCGPTVYDYIHIGNARTFVFFDVVAKYLKHKGYDVDYVQNITDIDNKIIERADKEGMDSLEYAKKYSDIFKQDMEALGVTSPEYKNATDHIPEVIQQVQTLLDKGNAYVIENDGIYFNLSTFPDYGKLSGRTASMADDAVSRIDDSDKKRNRGDFALWKFSQAGDPSTEFLGGLKHRQETTPSWPAPFGDGRPGWHIEDTAITEKYFGPQYDIHGGGEDLKFPHHEAEIAQQESASGLKPFVKYWMHVAFLINKEEKMSKSKGNVASLGSNLGPIRRSIFRIYFLSAHYRSPLSFEEKFIRHTTSASLRLANFQWRMHKVGGSGHPEADSWIEETNKKFYSALDDDFNTAASIGVVFEFINKINPQIDMLSDIQQEKILKFLTEVDSILGILPPPHEEVIPDNINKLIEQREKYRQDKNFSEADKIRAQIEEMGYRVDDTAYGPLISPN